MELFYKMYFCGTGQARALGATIVRINARKNVPLASWTHSNVKLDSRTCTIVMFDKQNLIMNQINFDFFTDGHSTMFDW